MVIRRLWGVGLGKVGVVIRVGMVIEIVVGVGVCVAVSRVVGVSKELYLRGGRTEAL